MQAQEISLPYQPFSKSQANPGILNAGDVDFVFLHNHMGRNVKIRKVENRELLLDDFAQIAKEINVDSLGSVNIDPFEECVLDLRHDHKNTACIFWDTLIEDNNNDFKKPIIEELSQDLNDLFEECSKENWDGEDAVAIDLDTIAHTMRFLELLPLGTPLPELDADPHGLITFEWDLAPRRTLVVGIDSKGFIYYSALFDDEDERGKVRLDLESSQNIALLVQKVFSE